MTLTRRLAELRPGLRWRSGQAVTRLLYSRAFASIGDRVFLGQRCVVLGDVAMGDGATVGAHAVVTRDVAPGQTVVGIPARPVGA